LVSIMVASLVLGMFSGLIAGLFGIGGGIIIVPVLVLLFKVQGLPHDLIMIMAIATSLAAIIITATSSVLAHHRLGSVLWDKVFRLIPGIMLGAIVGAVVADSINTGLLKAILIAHLLYVGTEMALARQPKPGSENYSKLTDFGVASLIGLFSSLVGIGGGTLTVPYLVHCHYAMRNAIAIAAACTLPIAVGGTLSYMVLGMRVAHIPEWSFGYVYGPAFAGVALSSLFTAPIGAKLAHKLPALKLKRYFSVLIFILAAKLIWQ